MTHLADDLAKGMVTVGHMTEARDMIRRYRDLAPSSHWLVNDIAAALAAAEARGAAGKARLLAALEKARPYVRQTQYFRDFPPPLLAEIDACIAVAKDAAP